MRKPVLLALLAGMTVCIGALSSCTPAIGTVSLRPAATLSSAVVLTADSQMEPSRTRAAETASPIPSPPATLTKRPAATATAVLTNAPGETPAQTSMPTITPTPTITLTPSSTPAPSVTPWPTPENLPPASAGWQWQLHATGIPVTHYIIYEASAEDWEGPLERPYGLDDQPLPGIEPLPQRFLQQTAYQGSGRLPNGEILQYAAVRPPVEKGLVPFRYLIFPAEQCAGHPRAGNGTCSVPLETAATTWREGEEPLVPIGSMIFIPELNRKIRINDVAFSDGPAKIDLYTGTVNNYDHERPNGAAIWILTQEE